jgi:fatty-acyl-CoA synthase
VHRLVRRADEFIMELEHARFGDFDLSTLRTGIVGGAGCPVEVIKQVQQRMRMRQVTIICGMTETAPLSTRTAVDDQLDKQVGTVGRAAHPHVEIKIVDPTTGQTVPRGVAGEQCTAATA